MGSATMRGMSSPSETTTREIESVLRMLPNQAGGPVGVLRTFRIFQGRSLQNGKTVACRGAGQSARIPFPLRSMVCAKFEMRTPGGIRVSNAMLC